MTLILTKVTVKGLTIEQNGMVSGPYFTEQNFTVHAQETLISAYRCTTVLENPGSRNNAEIQGGDIE